MAISRFSLTALLPIRTEERPESWRKSKPHRQVTGQTRGQELRGKNDEELGPRAWAIVKLTDSAPRLAAIVARVTIDFVDCPSRLLILRRKSGELSHSE